MAEKRSAISPQLLTPDPYLLSTGPHPFFYSLVKEQFYQLSSDLIVRRADDPAKAEKMIWRSRNHLALAINKYPESTP
jgi:hypothetical protein